MMNTASTCPFCTRANILFENNLAYAIADTSPVNPGHLLIIPKTHVADFFQLNSEEKAAMLALLDEARQYLDAKHAPGGYNIGINVGELAGQTVMHAHLHLIPRYEGDTPNPRGGVRGVIPSRQSY